MMPQAGLGVAGLAATLLAVGCAAPRPTVASLAGEPVLTPLPDQVVLAEVSMQPRRSRVGVTARDGVVERVVAVDLLPAAAADLVQQRTGERYGFRRTDLGVGTPVTVELRGSAPTGAEVIVTASSGPSVPLYGGTDDVLPVPPDRPTTIVISVVSR